jgi:phosphoglycolate phosphatase
MIKTLIFDFDGTLASTAEGIHACMCETFHAFGYPRPSLADVRKTIGLLLEPSIRQLIPNDGRESRIPAMLALYRELYHAKAPAMSHLFEGAAETLALLRSLGMQMILVSNKGRRGLKQLTEHLKIKDDMDVILGMDDVAYRKPDARLFTEHIARYSPDRKQVLMVGDTETDLLFARNAGLQSCWAAYGYGDAEKCRALEPDFVIRDITELAALVSSQAPPRRALP